jgi:hypothetical protein
MWRGVLLVLAVCILAATPNHAARGKQYSAESNQTGPTALQPPEYYRPCNEDNADQNSDLCAQWSSAKWTKLGFFAALVAAVGVVTTLWFNLEAWRQARRSENNTDVALKHAETSAKASAKLARSAEDTSRRRLRAYMTFAKIHVHPRGREFGVQIEWINRGATPARQANSYTDWIELDHRLPEDFKFTEEAPGEDNGPMVVGPDQSMFGSSDKRMSVDLLKTVARGEKRVYLWGSVTYVDAFGKQRRTEMAVKLLPEELPIAELGKVEFDIRWDALHRHNDIDEHCEKRR